MNICGFFVVGALEMQLLSLAFLYKQVKLLGRGRGRGEGEGVGEGEE